MKLFKDRSRHKRKRALISQERRYRPGCEAGSSKHLLFTPRRLRAAVYLQTEDRRASSIAMATHRLMWLILADWSSAVPFNFLLMELTDLISCSQEGRDTISVPVLRV